MPQFTIFKERCPRTYIGKRLTQRPRQARTLLAITPDRMFEQELLFGYSFPLCKLREQTSLPHLVSSPPGGGCVGSQAGGCWGDIVQASDSRSLKGLGSIWKSGISPRQGPTPAHLSLPNARMGQPGLVPSEHVFFLREAQLLRILLQLLQK